MILTLETYCFGCVLKLRIWSAEHYSLESIKLNVHVNNQLNQQVASYMNIQRFMGVRNGIRMEFIGFDWLMWHKEMRTSLMRPDLSWRCVDEVSRWARTLVMTNKSQSDTKQTRFLKVLKVKVLYFNAWPQSEAAGWSWCVLMLIYLDWSSGLEELSESGQCSDHTGSDLLQCWWHSWKLNMHGAPVSLKTFPTDAL